MELCGKCSLPMKNGQARCLRCGTDAARPEGVSAPEQRHAFGSVCGRCGALLPEGCGRCLVCATERDAVPFGGQFPVPPERPAHSPEPYRNTRPVRKAPDTLRGLGRTLSVLICVMAVALTGYGVWQQYFDTSGYRAGDSVVYETADRNLMLFHPGLKTPLEVNGIDLEGTAFSDGTLIASPNDRRLAYHSAGNKLYVLDLARSNQSDGVSLEAALLAEEVVGQPVFSQDGSHLVYHTADKGLSATNYAETWRLDDDVARLLAVENNRALYTRREEKDGRTRSDLYIDEILKGSREWTLIDRDIVEVLDWTPGFDRILYTANRPGEDDHENVSLLSFELRLGSFSLLASGVDRVMDASAASNSVIYLTRRQQIWSYNQFVNDDLAEIDAAITKPILEDYPELAEAYSIYGEGAALTDLEETEELVEQNVAYNSALRLWEAKNRRDEVRRRLHARFARQSEPLALYDLHLFRNGELTLLDTGVWMEPSPSREPEADDAGKGYILYERIDPGSLRRLKMSVVWETPSLAEINLNQYFLGNVSRALVCLPLDGRPTLLYAGGGGLAQKLWRAVPEANGIYFTVGPAGSPGKQDELYYATLQGSVSNAVKVASGVDILYGSYRSELLYGTVDGAIHLAKDGGARRLGGGTARFGSLEDGGAALLFYSSFAEQTDSGELYLFAGAEALLAGNVTAYDYRSDHLVYLQHAGADGVSPGLYMWRAGKLALLEEDFRGVLGIESETRAAKTASTA